MYKKVVQISVVLSLFLLGFSFVSGQDKATKMQSAKGELVSVDTTASLLTIKTADGQELQFQFNDQTEISGAQDEVAGLATSEGSQVSIEYRTEEGHNLAVRITVSPRAG